MSSSFLRTEAPIRRSIAVSEALRAWKYMATFSSNTRTNTMAAAGNWQLRCVAEISQTRIHGIREKNEYRKRYQRHYKRQKMHFDHGPVNRLSRRTLCPRREYVALTYRERDNGDGHNDGDEPEHDWQEPNDYTHCINPSALCSARLLDHCTPIMKKRPAGNPASRHHTNLLRNQAASRCRRCASSFLRIRMAVNSSIGRFMETVIGLSSRST